MTSRLIEKCLDWEEADHISTHPTQVYFVKCSNRDNIRLLKTLRPGEVIKVESVKDAIIVDIDFWPVLEF